MQEAIVEFFYNCCACLPLDLNGLALLLGTCTLALVCMFTSMQEQALKLQQQLQKGQLLQKRDQR